MRPIPGSLVALAFMAALGAERTARADAASLALAEALFDQGVKMMGEERYAEACPKLAESLRLDVGIGTMLWLADCYGKVGKTASAWAQFREAAWTAEKQNDARVKLARQRASELEPQLSKIVVIVPRPVDGLEVLRDGGVLRSVAWGTEVPVDPGEHTVVVSAPKKKTWQTTVVLLASQRLLAVTVPALEDLVPVLVPAPAPAPVVDAPVSKPAVRPSALGAQRVAGLVVAGTGLLALGVGSFYGLRAKSKLDDSSAHCTNNVCDPAGGEARSEARSSATVSTVSFVVGITALAGGGLLYFLAPSRRLAVTPVVGTSSVGLEFGGHF